MSVDDYIHFVEKAPCHQRSRWPHATLELRKALALCRKHKTKLVIAKLDRLSRNLAFIATLMDSGVEFVAVDNPHANKLTIHILAAVAQHEREMIGERTKAALQAAKRRGVKLGRNASERLAPKFRMAAQARAVELMPIISKLRSNGLSARSIARELESQRVPTPKGGRWHAQSVLRVIKRLQNGIEPMNGRSESRHLP